jgi:hypothetical protein
VVEAVRCTTCSVIAAGVKKTQRGFTLHKHKDTGSFIRLPVSFVFKGTDLVLNDSRTVDFPARVSVSTIKCNASNNQCRRRPPKLYEDRAGDR